MSTIGTSREFCGAHDLIETTLNRLDTTIETTHGKTVENSKALARIEVSVAALERGISEVMNGKGSVPGMNIRLDRIEQLAERDKVSHGRLAGAGLSLVVSLLCTIICAVASFIMYSSASSFRNTRDVAIKDAVREALASGNPRVDPKESLKLKNTAGGFEHVQPGSPDKSGSVPAM